MNKIMLISVLTCLVLAIPCAARTITVDDDSPADFSNIHAAVHDSGNVREVHAIVTALHGRLATRTIGELGAEGYKLLATALSHLGVS